MKVQQLGSNRTLVRLNDTDEVLFSYATPVAGFKSGIGYFRTDTRYSVTTSKHIGQYLRGMEAVTLPQSQIDTMTA